MLSERQLEALLDVFRKRMQGVTEEYLIRMGEHLRDIGQLTASDINRIVEMKRLNANMEQVKRDIAKAARMSAEDIEKIFKAVAESDLRFANKVFASDHNPSIKSNPALERMLKAQAKITKQELSNLSQTTLISDGYKNAVDVAVQTVQAGITDYTSAIRRAMKSAAQEGLRVQYPNSGMTRRLDSAVRMNVLDGVRAVNQDIMRQVGKEFKADGIELSAHNLCAEDHLPYQGTQMSIKEFDRLQERLDRPFGMWNCHHTWHYIILGISKPAYTPEELEEFKRNSNELIEIGGITKTRYQWTQEQRRIETAIRYQKDIAVAAKASGDMMTRRECQYTINKLWERYDKVNEAAGLIEKPERTRVVGFSAVKTAEDLAKNAVAASPMFLNKTDLLYKNAQKIKPLPGYEDIVVHADKVGFVFKDAGGKESNVSVADFAEILKESNVYHGGAIRLIACESAADGAITAQSLSNILGVEILAPNDVVYVNEEGEMTIGHPLTNKGKWIKIEPRKKR